MAGTSPAMTIDIVCDDKTKTAGDCTGRCELLIDRDQTAALIHCCSFCFGAAPT
jgi:hypothetical protein